MKRRQVGNTSTPWTPTDDGHRMKKLPESGADLQALRERRGLTQKDLGELLDLHEKSVARLEGMKRIPRVTAIAAATVLAASRRRR